MDNLTYSKPNILVVDDVSADLITLSDIIHKAGYMARPVTNAIQAKSAISQLMPHLIILDISMPDLEGFELCSWLKDKADTRDIPIIFIISGKSKEDKINCHKLGAVDYISKPFEVEEVAFRINIHLKVYRMQHELEVYNKKLHKAINEQIRRIYEEQKNMLYALARIVTIRDGKSAKHLENTGKNSRLLALGLQLSPNFEDEITNSYVDLIELAAPLHDIGKLSVPDDAHQNHGNMGQNKGESLKTHSEEGANILKEIYTYSKNNEFIKMAIDIAECHHEHWDGSGYPRGLSYDDIPLSARIVAVVNKYDALSQKMVGDRLMDQDEVFEIINKASGTKLDPSIVIVFNKLRNKLVM